MQGLDAMRSRAMAVTDAQLASAGTGSLTPVDQLRQQIQQAQTLLAGLGLQTESAGKAQDDYKAAFGALNTLLKDGVINQGQYNAQLDKAQEKLVAARPGYDALANSIGVAAARQAELNNSLAHMKVGVDQGSASTGDALKYGALSWMQQQGNSDQQLSKAVGGSLDALTNDAGTFFDSWRAGTQSASQAFRQFGASVFADAAKIIEKLLILRSVQSLIGLVSGGGGSFTTGYEDAGGGANLYGPSDWTVPTHHTGGVIGCGGAGSATVSPLAFLGAPRYHAGGMLGLGPDEVPIVGQRGERILNRQQTAEWNRSGGGTTVNQISIPLVDTSGNASKNSGLTTADLKALQPQMQALVDARIQSKLSARDRSAS